MGNICSQSQGQVQLQAGEGRGECEQVRRQAGSQAGRQAGRQEQGQQGRGGEKALFVVGCSTIKSHLPYDSTVLLYYHII